jgi:serine/threonine-protein kinase
MKECPICKRCYSDDVNNCPNDGEPTTQSIQGEPVLDGRYLLEQRLGQGGMGVVFKARHVFLKTAHAIKVILPDLVGNDPMLVTRFRQEALAAAAIRHQNIIAVTDFGVARGTMPFLVMEFVSGESLHDLLAREKALPPARALEIMYAIGAGVAAAHRQGIVHRDLKPLNVMMQEGLPLNEGLKILDFGLAKIKSGEVLGSFVQAKTTGLMGSPYYMAPEQWADEEPDVQSDIYSLGVMLFQMLAGDVPFKGNSFPAIMKKHLSEPPPSFANMGANVPPQIEAAVRHALEKERANRTRTVEAFIQELRVALNASTSQLQETAIGTGQTTPTLIPPSTGDIPLGAKTGTTTLYLHTIPPQASIFLNGNFVGASDPLGAFVLTGLPNGVHRVRVSHDGFHDWEHELRCQGGSLNTSAELRSFFATNVMTDGKQASSQFGASSQQIGTSSSTSSIPQTSGFETRIDYESAPQGVTSPIKQHGTQPIDEVNAAALEASRQMQTGHISQTNAANLQASQKFHVSESSMQGMTSMPPSAVQSSLPIILSVLALGGVLLLVAALGVYKFVIQPRTIPGGADNPTPTPTPIINSKANMVLIKGGEFTMGRENGPEQERPAHKVPVQDFWMDKTEVTNAEYLEFTKATGHPTPQHWEEGQPLQGQENWPVVYVSFDDVKAFADWRSKRDETGYRLPTEQEWEYAARNGADQNLYPWGNDWDNNKAIIGKSIRPVGSMPEGKNRWGVLDLIGNVWEWTSTPAQLYPGSELVLEDKHKGKIMIRGGSFAETHPDKVYGQMTSTLRVLIGPESKRPNLGFRLVRAASEDK